MPNNNFTCHSAHANLYSYVFQPTLDLLDEAVMLDNFLIYLTTGIRLAELARERGVEAGHVISVLEPVGLTFCRIYSLASRNRLTDGNLPSVAALVLVPVLVGIG